MADTKFCYTIVNDNANPHSKNGLVTLCNHFCLEIENLPHSIDSAVAQLNNLPRTMSMTRLTPKATKDLIKGDVKINFNSETNSGAQVWPGIRSTAEVPAPVHSMWIGNRGALTNYKVLVFPNVPARVVLQAGREGDGPCFLKLLTHELKQIECKNPIIELEADCTWELVFKTMYLRLRRDRFWQFTEVSVLGPFIDESITDPIKYNVNINTIEMKEKVDDTLILPPSSPTMREMWEKLSSKSIKRFLEIDESAPAPTLKKQRV